MGDLFSLKIFTNQCIIFTVLNRMEGKGLELSARIPLSKHSTFTRFEQGFKHTMLTKTGVTYIYEIHTQEAVDSMPYPDSATQ